MVVGDNLIDVNHLCRVLNHAGSPGQEIVPKRRKTIARGRDFTVRIEFAAKIRMRAIDEMMRGATGRCNQELEIRASEALRVLDILLRESASQRYALLGCSIYIT